MKKENEKVWSELARVPRRSYLGKYRRLTPSQNRWVRSLLNHWGSVFGGVELNTFQVAAGCGQ